MQAQIKLRSPMRKVIPSKEQLEKHQELLLRVIETLPFFVCLFWYFLCKDKKEQKYLAQKVQ